MTIYVDTDDFKAANALGGTTFNTDAIDQAIAAASAGVEKVQGDRDYGQSDEQERWFHPSDSEVLEIDDVADLASVRVDPTGSGDYETWTVDVDFRLEPMNAVAKGKPHTHMRVLTGRRFPVGRLARVGVTAVFGWPAVPPQIVEATQIVASQLLQRKEKAPFGFVFTGDTAAYLIRKDPQFEFLLSGLRRDSELHSVKLR